MPQGVSIVTVTWDGFFFTRLLVEKVRQFMDERPYEIIVVDRRSKDGSRSWLKGQPDVRLLTFGRWRTTGHGHGDAAEAGVRAARFDRIVLLDSDAHPVAATWLRDAIDKLDDHYRLAGAAFVDKHRGNPHGWYIHPFFMAFFKSDLGGRIVLRKVRGDDTDTGEEATIRVLAADKGIIQHHIAFCPDFDVGHPGMPSVAGGVFHAWYMSRLEHNENDVIRETRGRVTSANYLVPLKKKLREIYGLTF